MMIFGCAIVDAGRELCRCKTAKHHGMWYPQPCAGEHRHSCLRHHRHVDDNPVAFLDAIAAQHGCQRNDIVFQFFIADRALIAGDWAVINDRCLIGSPTFDMAVNAIVTGIECAIGVPATIGALIVEEGFRRFFEPVDPTCRLHPKRFRIGLPAFVHICKNTHKPFLPIAVRIDDWFSPTRVVGSMQHWAEILQDLHGSLPSNGHRMGGREITMYRINLPLPAILVSFALLLTSCANNEIILPLAVQDSRHAVVLPIHVATLRQRSDDGYAVYSGDRSDALNFAQIDVSIPKERKKGTIVYPRKVPNLKEQFAAVGHTTNRDEAQFIAAVNRSLAVKPRENQAIFLFVHGYNTNFASGIFRQAQMVHDFDFPGVAVNFSWASAGKTALYLYDRESAHLARQGLRQTLKTLSKTNARSITLLGHSMGGFVTMEALREISIRREKGLLNRLGMVVLASPDIENAVFYEQLAELRPMPDPFVLFVSQNDRALQISTRLRGGGSRLGQGQDIEKLRSLGVTVVDLSTIGDGADRTNHTTFATSETVMQMVQSDALNQNARTDNAQNPLAPVGEGIGKLSDIASKIIYLPAKVAGVR